MAGTCCTTLVEIRCLWKYLIDGQAWVMSLLATLVTKITRLGIATKKVQRELKWAKGTGSIEESKLKEQRKKNLKKSRARSLNLIKSALVMLLGCFSWLLALSHHLSPEAWVSSLPSYYAIRMPIVMLLMGWWGSRHIANVS